MALDNAKYKPGSDISEPARQRQSKSMVIHVVALSLTKTADGLVDPKLTLTWLLGALGAPAAMVAWLVPIRESLSLLPQMFVASRMRKHAIRKTFWSAGSLLQGLAVLAMGIVALSCKGILAGGLILALLALFSLARGVCSVAIKDVQGKTIAKSRRGKVSGLAASVGGVSLLVFGAALSLGLLDNAEQQLLGTLLIAGAGLWLLAAAIYQQLPELEGDVESGAQEHVDIRHAFRAALKMGKFRRFLLTRALLLSSALMTPFLVSLSFQSPHQLRTLGALLLASGLAGFISGPIWGHLADKSSRTVLYLAPLITAATGLGAWWFGVASSLGFALLIFTTNLAHAGIRLGRKTYVIDMANQHNRAVLVSLSNTLIGMMLLLAGAFSALLASIIDTRWLVLGLSLIALLAAWSAWTMEEA